MNPKKLRIVFMYSHPTYQFGQPIRQNTENPDKAHFYKKIILSMKRLDPKKYDIYYVNQYVGRDFTDKPPILSIGYANQIDALETIIGEENICKRLRRLNRQKISQEISETREKSPYQKPKKKVKCIESLI